jgi:hypothetical protein
MSPELSIILLVLIVVIVAYTSIYPKVAGNDFTKVSMCDLIVSGFVLTGVGFKYWGTDQTFSLIFFETNWFWFTFIVFALIEAPTVFLYAKKHKMKL